MGRSMERPRFKLLAEFLLLVTIMSSSFGLVKAGDFVLVADLNNGTIYKGSMKLGLSDMEPLPLRGVVRPVAVDYDPVEKMMYWTDLYSLPSPGISRAKLDGSDQMTLIHDIRLPDGLALDVESRTMFWTDGTLGLIEKAFMNGTGREVVLRDLDKPRTIIVDSIGGHIYWTDWGSNPRIERADFDGSNRRTIIQGDLEWPNGVTMNKERTLLYWCDAKLDKIESSDLLGNNRELLVNLTTYENIHPFDVALYGDYVYWTDWGYVVLLRVHKTGRGIGIFGPRVFQRAGGIHIEEEPDYCDSSPCQNGATCVDIINGFSCQCLAGYGGPTCDQAVNSCDSRPCLHGGTCFVMIAGDGFICLCHDGYEGPTCAIEPDYCDSSPCQNGATCVDIINGFSCQCLAGYGGPTCDQVVNNCDSRPCLNGGTCSSVAGGFTCQCHDGYVGSTCAIDLGNCCDSSPCLNGGTCYCVPGGYACNCRDGYEGPTCDQVVNSCDSRPCLNGGTCSSVAGGFTCLCHDGYVGSTCDQATGRRCDPPPVEDHVILAESVHDFYPGDEATFTCSEGYFIKGSQEDESITRICRSGGTWSGETITCTPTGDGGSTEPFVVPIVGGGIGGVLFIIILIVVVVMVTRRCRKRSEDERIVVVPPIYDIETSFGQTCGTLDAPPYLYIDPEHIYEDAFFNRNSGIVHPAPPAYSTHLATSAPQAPPAYSTHLASHAQPDHQQSTKSTSDSPTGPNQYESMKAQSPNRATSLPHK